MTINQAIRILDPDTSAEALGEIEYYGGLHGREKMVAACDEACRVAVQIMRKIHGGTKMKKKIMAALLCGAMMCSLSACRESERVAYNISKEADNFNVTRRLEVINARTDKPVFELIGNFAISNNSENELEVTVETGQGVYKKHLVYLNDWTIYVVEDVSGAYVDKFHYEVNFLPEMIIPVTVTSHD